MKIDIDPEKREAFEARLAELEPWMHAFQFGPETIVGFYKYEGLGLDETSCTPQSDPQRIRRLQNAYALRNHAEHFGFYEDMLSIIPKGEREKLSVLDLASATGEFSFWAVDQGFGRVTSVEIRDNQVAQQRLILDSTSNADYRNRIELIHEPMSADVPAFAERYGALKPDVVFSFGLLYHLANPIQHLRNLYDITQRYAFIYTTTHHEPCSEAAWILRFEEPEIITKGVEGANWRPHFNGLIKTLKHIGFRNVRIAYPPRFARHFPEYDRYDQRARRRMRLANLLRRAGLTTGYLRNFEREYYRYSGLNPNYFGYILEK